MTKAQLKQIEKELQTMSPSALIMHIVNGLKKEWHPVKMQYYFKAEQKTSKNFVCYGCAATNAIADILQAPIFKTEKQEHVLSRLLDEVYEYNIFGTIETALNELRTGNMGEYNHILRSSGLGLKNLFIPEEFVDDYLLPALENEDYLDWLDDYVEFAEKLKAAGH
jgi:hypothetical protein